MKVNDQLAINKGEDKKEEEKGVLALERLFFTVFYWFFRSFVMSVRLSVCLCKYVYM